MCIELVMPSNHLILSSPSPPASIFPSIRVFSNESVPHIRWPKYWSFSLNISPSNEYSWLISFIFQVPMHYCSWQHWTLLVSPVTSTTGYCFCFGSIPSFFLELFLHWSPVAYWAPNDMGSSSFGVLSFCLFLLFMGFSRQEYWSGFAFPSPVDHILSGLSTMTRLLCWLCQSLWLCGSQ